MIGKAGGGALFTTHALADVIRVSRNRVDGNLQCKENRNSPSGGGNRVRGNKEDQCARL